MDAACRSVATQLDRASADLQLVSHRLERELDTQYQDLPASQHPHSLLERLHKLGEEVRARAAQRTPGRTLVPATPPPFLSH